MGTEDLRGLLKVADLVSSTFLKVFKKHFDISVDQIDSPATRNLG